MSDALTNLKDFIDSKPDLSQPKIADLETYNDTYAIAILIDPKKISHMGKDSKDYIYGVLSHAVAVGMRDAQDHYSWNYGSKLEYSARACGALTEATSLDIFPLADDDSFEGIMNRMNAVMAPQNIKDAFQAGHDWGKKNLDTEASEMAFNPFESGSIFTAWLEEQEEGIHGS